MTASGHGEAGNEPMRDLHFSKGLEMIGRKRYEFLVSAVV
jgi:hypothetical protein